MIDQKSEVKEKLCSIYSQVLEREIPIEEFEAGTGLLEKYHIDSLIALQIIVRIEQVFGIVIEDDNVAVEMLDNLHKAVDFINNNGPVA